MSYRTTAAKYRSHYPDDADFLPIRSVEDSIEVYRETLERFAVEEGIKSGGAEKIRELLKQARTEGDSFTREDVEKYLVLL